MIDIKLTSYEEFIKKFKVYSSRKEAREKNFEAHHIVPKAIQIKEKGYIYDDRCVRLTYEEHIFAHYLLARENPTSPELFFAFNAMVCMQGKMLLEDERKLLEELPYFVEMKDSIGDLISKNKKGKPFSEEHIQHIRDAHKLIDMSGINNPMYGKHHSDETKKKISEKSKGRIATEETRRKMSIAHKNPSEETRKKISEAGKGRPSPMKGKHLSDETKAKIKGNNKSYLQRKKVYKYSLDGELEKVYDCLSDCAKDLGIGIATVSNYANKKYPSRKKLSYSLSYN